MIERNPKDAIYVVNQWTKDNPENLELHRMAQRELIEMYLPEMKGDTYERAVYTLWWLNQPQGTPVDPELRLK